MSAFSPSAKIGIAGGFVSIVAFSILFVGLGAIGGGHGSPVIWYVGLAAAALSGILLLATVARSVAKKSERRILIPSIAAVAACSVLWLKFFTIAEWFSEILHQ